ncbi:MAG: UDP-glucose 4-epimerase [Solirubrobacteraceae bacterium]|nr:UDP-glucose 4-epimerase [Solirubrobacteraceae bacterium]
MVRLSESRATASKRILITGLSTDWGGRVAQMLESNPEVETVIGVDRRPPKVELQRTEFVEVADSHSLIRRIVEAAEIDTVVDTRLVVDGMVTSPRLAHENNVIGTMNVLAACSGVRKLVFKSSAHFYGVEQDDPAFFTEAMGRSHPPRTRLEKDINEAESAVEDFRHRNPDTIVTVLRFANGLGPGRKTSNTRLLDLPAIPAILGFDPRIQYIHDEDMANALEHAVRHDIDGVFNAAADGVLVLSEIASLLGKQLAPVLSPWATGLGAGVLRRAGVPLTPETLRMLRFGRALDNRRLKATGFRYRYTTRETVLKLREHQRLASLTRGSGEGYRYERELEEFLRYSPSVRAANAAPTLPKNVAAGGDASAAQVHTPQVAPPPVRKPRPKPVRRRPAPPPPPDYADLESEEIIALLSDLDAEQLERLREHEAATAARPTVLTAIDSLVARTNTPV